MAQKDDDKKKEYQRRYYQEHIKGDPEKMAHRSKAQKDYLERTGYEAITRHKKNNYTRIALDVKNDIAERYKAKCKSLGVSYSEPLQKAIIEFLEEDDEKK